MPPPTRAVLIASDVPYARVLMKQTLAQQGCTVTTAVSVAEAMRHLESRTFELLVIDLINPEDASEQLLLQVRVGANPVPVLLLSNQLDRDLLRRLGSLRPVGFLTKPLSVNALKELLPLALKASDSLLLRSIELSRFKPGADGRNRADGGTKGAQKAAASMVEDSKVDEARLKWMFGELPLLPHVVTRILQIGDDPDSSVKELADVVSADPRLCGQLLRIVNSAYFGFSRRVATVPEATVILGVQAIRNLCISAAVSGFFGGRGKLLDRGRLWRHALGVAVAARKIAERANLPISEEAFTAGLLHDFGRLALERHLADTYGKCLALSRTDGVPLLEAEEQIMGVNHAWLSGWLAQQWNLPAILADAMTWHHKPESATDQVRLVAAAVNVGDVICHVADLGGIDGVPLTNEASAYAAGLVQMEPEVIAEIVPELVREATQLEQQLMPAG